MFNIHYCNSYDTQCIHLCYFIPLQLLIFDVPRLLRARAGQACPTWSLFCLNVCIVNPRTYTLDLIFQCCWRECERCQLRKRQSSILNEQPGNGRDCNSLCLASCSRFVEISCTERASFRELYYLLEDDMILGEIRQ